MPPSQNKEHKKSKSKIGGQLKEILKIVIKKCIFLA